LLREGIFVPDTFGVAVQVTVEIVPLECNLVCLGSVYLRREILINKKKLLDVSAVKTLKILRKVIFYIRRGMLQLPQRKTLSCMQTRIICE